MTLRWPNRISSWQNHDPGPGYHSDGDNKTLLYKSKSQTLKISLFIYVLYFSVLLTFSSSSECLIRDLGLSLGFCSVNLLMTNCFLFFYFFIFCLKIVLFVCVLGTYLCRIQNSTFVFVFRQGCCFIVIWFHFYSRSGITLTVKCNMYFLSGYFYDFLSFFTLVLFIQHYIESPIQRI